MQIVHVVFCQVLHVCLERDKAICLTIIFSNYQGVAILTMRQLAVAVALKGGNSLLYIIHLTDM